MIYKTLHSDSTCQSNLLQTLFKEHKNNGASINLAWDPMFCSLNKATKGYKNFGSEAEKLWALWKAIFYTLTYIFPPSGNHKRLSALGFGSNISAGPNPTSSTSRLFLG